MKVKVLFTALSMVLLSSCAALDEYMDSSVGPEGHQQSTASHRHNGTNSSASSQNRSGNNSTSRASDAGVVKPYVPDESVSSAAPAASNETPVLSNAQETQQLLPDEPQIPVVPLQSSAEANSQNLSSAETAAPSASAEPEVIDVQDARNSQPVLTIPDYARSENLHGNCSNDLNGKVQQAAKELGDELGAKLKADSGAIYVAPTVIPDEFSDCVKDAAPSVKSTITNGGKFTLAQTGGIVVSQNIGSAVVIPSLIRECKKQGIPYLAYSLLGKRGGKVRLTLRIIRVSDGITLTQNYKNLD